MSAQARAGSKPFFATRVDEGAFCRVTVKTPNFQKSCPQRCPPSTERDRTERDWLLIQVVPRHARFARVRFFFERVKVSPRVARPRAPFETRAFRPPSSSSGGSASSAPSPSPRRTGSRPRAPRRRRARGSTPARQQGGDPRTGSIARWRDEGVVAEPGSARRDARARRASPRDSAVRVPAVRGARADHRRARAQPVRQRYAPLRFPRAPRRCPDSGSANHRFFSTPVPLTRRQIVSRLRLRLRRR